MHLAPWCYNWTELGWDGTDLRVGWSIEHLTNDGNKQLWYELTRCPCLPLGGKVWQKNKLQRNQGGKQEKARKKTRKGKKSMWLSQTKIVFERIYRLERLCIYRLKCFWIYRHEWICIYRLQCFCIYRLKWSGLVWSGLVWSGLVRSGPVRSGLVWSGPGLVLRTWHIMVETLKIYIYLA